MVETSMSTATEHLGNSLNGLQDALGAKIDQLADSIDELAGATEAGDVTSCGVSDGDIVKLQFDINEDQKASEAAVNVWGKAQQISKSTFKGAAQA
ncbi:hypothetical protein ACFL4J_01880 [Candidatus Margulisiibacteriota bacterium]